VVGRAYRSAREKGNTEIANGCFCYQLAMVGFLVSITFLSNAYWASLPLMVSLGIGLSVAAARQLAARPGPSQMLPIPARY
jgi:hypothetical protein